MESYKFTVPVQIRMSDLDPFVHVNNGAQCHYFDLGRSAYLEKVLQNPVDWKTVNMVLVHISMDFKRPVLFADEIVCDSKVYELGVRSFKMQQQIRDMHTGEIKTVCRSAVCRFDRQTLASMPLSDEQVRLIREFEGIETL
ncbi:MAG: thioesterase family protein [Bacteroidales bacterium]|jgi:acyl-CoA thioester hydrolase|nr:thioesterase family protein [Bacteroidales bacterium]